MSLQVNSQTPVAPPIAKKVPKVLSAHGDQRQDPYFWLREKGNPEVIAYLEAENRHTESVMKPGDGLQEKLYKEIVARIKETDLSVPVRRAGYFYYTRTEQGKQYPIWCRKKGTLSAAEEIILDGNELAEGRKYMQVGAAATSPDQALLAYAVDFEGDESYTIHFKDLQSGKLLEDRIEKATESLAWANDNKTLFYVTRDEALRPFKLFRHSLGEPKDIEIFHEKDERFTVEISKSRSLAYLWIDVASQTTSEVRYLRADRPQDAFTVLLPRQQDIEYDVTHQGDQFYIRINDQGRNFRLVATPVQSTSRSHWREVLPHRPEVMIESTDGFRDHLVVLERDRGLKKLRIRKASTGAEHFVEFQEPTYSVAPNESGEYNSNVMRFTYVSLVTPSTVYDYDMDTRQKELKKQQEVLGGYDPTQYRSERLLATAQDGVKIPISIVYRNDFRKDGQAPVLLYGYGSYGLSSDPVFSSERLSLLNRGFAFAIAHIRGGGDLGKTWHDAGRMMRKRTSFTDFIACAQHLIDQKYTKPATLAILGGSAGGLLMGAVVNLRPELFGAVIAKVPFVDVLSTMADTTLPLTVGEFEEWGNPENKDAYLYMRSYSPYDNVESQKFPHLLVTAGLNDPRVSYWEPAKWVARLRELKKGNNLLLLKTNMGAGHFGASGRYERYKETAFDYAFLFRALGVPVD